MVLLQLLWARQYRLIVSEMTLAELSNVSVVLIAILTLFSSHSFACQEGWRNIMFPFLACFSKYQEVFASIEKLGSVVFTLKGIIETEIQELGV